MRECRVPRLFVALEPPEDLRRALSRLGADLTGARPTRPEQLHLTLRFLGELDETTTAGLTEALEDIDQAAFELTPAGVGCFPNPRRPSVAWAGVQDSSPLTTLQAAVEAAARACGLAPETKVFHPHFTVARFRQPNPRAAKTWLAAHADFVAPAFRTGEFSLWASELRPQGARHRRRGTFLLRR
jgi:2'-5' RNA ligase